MLSLIGSLIAIGLPMLQSARAHSAASRCRSELLVLQETLETYRRQYGDYPQTGDASQADVSTAMPSRSDHAQVRFFNALTGVFGPNAPSENDRINGPSFIAAESFSLENPTSERFLTASGEPPRRELELTCLLDPWGRRYLYYYKSASSPDSWQAPSYWLFSSGPDGKLSPPDLLTGLFTVVAKRSPVNADNFYVESATP